MPVGVLQVLFQEYKNVGVLLWNPMKILLFQPFHAWNLRPQKQVSEDRSPHDMTDGMIQLKRCWVLVHAQHDGVCDSTVCFIPSGFGPVRNCTSAV